MCLAQGQTAVSPVRLEPTTLRSCRALTPLFGNGAGAHGIGKISGVLTKIGKFDIVLMYGVSIAKLIPIINLPLFLIYNV